MLDRAQYVSFRVDEKELAALDAAARRRGVTRSDLIRIQLLEVMTPYLLPVKDPNQLEMFGGSK